MWREDYLKPPYVKAEWRHCVIIASSERVTIERLSQLDSGGDGIYVGRRRRVGGQKFMFSRDIVVRNVVADGNARQGSSITAVENLLYEDCTFSNTRGCPPQAGVDIEPNGKDDPVGNCVFRNCRFDNNAGAGFCVACFFHDESSKPIDVTLENCRFLGNKSAIVYAQNKRITEKRGWNKVSGRLIVRGCSIEGAREHAIVLRKPGAYLKVDIEDCTIHNCCLDKPAMPEISFDHLYGDYPPTDAVTMKNVKIAQALDRDWVEFSDVGYAAYKVRDFTGDVTVTSPSGTKTIALDEAFCAWTFPAFWGEGEPRRRASASSADKVVDLQPGQLVALAKLRVRGDVRYVFHAVHAGTVSFKGRLVSVGKKPLSDDAAFEVRPLGGGNAAKVAIPVGDSDKTFAVNVPSAGFYSMRANIGGHSFQLSESDVPVGIDVSEKPVCLIGSCGDLYLSVRGGAPFNVMVSGESTAERVGAELFSPSGTRVWHEPAALWWHGWRGRGAVEEGLWKLRVSRPSKDRMEDFHVDATGIPGTLFLSSKKCW